MIRTAVESTTLRTVLYDPDRKLLQLEFCSNSVYRYFDVPAEIHQALPAASSKGRYFNRLIRDKFACTKIKTVSLS